MEELLYGRELLWKELPRELQKAIQEEKIKVKIIPSYYVEKGIDYCQRCQTPLTKVKAEECTCRQACAYCRNCIKMGKVKKCSVFYSLVEPNYFSNYKQTKLSWEGQLSKQQEKAARTVRDTVGKKAEVLLWAVTGSGKTEMVFRGIEYALLQQQRVCIATPRVDVCLELAPRLKAAFPHTSICVLYGEMEEPYAYTQLVISTTHQLFRFKDAFDVIIIDEIDAFPFYLDESLQFTVKKAQKKKAAIIYLSATPNKKMKKDISKNKLEAIILPARYHGHSLPVPQLKWCSNWRINVLKRFHRTSFGKKVAQKIKSHRRFLIFVPNIEWMLALEKTIQKYYPEVLFTAVYAEDPKRKEKIQKMRNQEFQFLLSTTILERGVTFSNIDVLVIGAEDSIFTEAALVQIAGRSGRSPQFPTGEVWFFHEGQSLAMKRAVKQIKEMNRLAKKRGLIDE